MGHRGNFEISTLHRANTGAYASRFAHKMFSVVCECCFKVFAANDLPAGPILFIALALDVSRDESIILLALFRKRRGVKHRGTRGEKEKVKEGFFLYVPLTPKNP